MAVRGLAAALLVLPLLLAGCIGGDDAIDAGSIVDAGNQTLTAPEGRNLIAFEETNKTEDGVGGVDHHHDYWQGATRVTMFEQPSQMAPMGVVFNNAAEYKAQAVFQPPQGTFVYEGTKTIEFTIKNPRRHVCDGDITFGGHFVCTSNLDKHRVPAAVPQQADPMGGPSGLKLYYKHASTVEWIEAGELKWGTPTVIEIRTATETDMPHATSSAWEFLLVSPNKYDTTLAFDAKVDLVRGEGDIPLWPGHPDFYSQSPYRRVLEADTVACDQTGCTLPGAEKAGSIAAQKLVSYGTRTLYVWINITQVTAPNPVTAPDNWFLWHWNSTGRDNVTDVFDKTNHSADKKEHHWVLPVDDAGMDSPYADGSRWRFQLGGAFYKAGLSCYGGCADWQAKYSIVVIASNEDLPLEKYDMACLRGDYCPQPGSGSGDATQHVQGTGPQRWLRQVDAA